MYVCVCVQSTSCSLQCGHTLPVHRHKRSGKIKCSIASLIIEHTMQQENTRKEGGEKVLIVDYSAWS